VWNEQTKQLVEEKKLVVIGVVQEQHAERARLYKQWKQYDFPIAQDSFTELGLSVVPVPILIDEFGYVQSAKPRLTNIGALVNKKSNPPANSAPRLDPKKRTAYEIMQSKPLEETLEKGKQLILAGDALIRQVSANRLVNFATYNDGSISSHLHHAIAKYHHSEEILVKHDAELLGALYFRLGVAYRMRFDKLPREARTDADFDRAIEYWSKAVERTPNQYIWRRRIQQYGPRQAKPYPFYDWVETAEKELLQRGEKPIELPVPLTESETAKPSNKFNLLSKATNPDPHEKINEAPSNVIQCRATVVPATAKPGQAVRVHLHFNTVAAKWNNEAENMVVWINESNSGQSEKSLIEFENPVAPTSTETRQFEFEYQTDKAATQNIEINGFALFNTCKSSGGQCLYLRKNFSIPILINP